MTETSVDTSLFAQIVANFDEQISCNYVDCSTEAEYRIIYKSTVTHNTQCRFEKGKFYCGEHFNEFALDARQYNGIKCSACEKYWVDIFTGKNITYQSDVIHRYYKI